MKEDRLRVTVGTIRSKVSHKESEFLISRLLRVM